MVRILFVPVQGGVSVKWAMALRALQLTRDTIVSFNDSSIPLDMVRNSGLAEAYQRRASSIFFLDSDVLPPPNAFQRLNAVEAPIVSGLVPRRQISKEIEFLYEPKTLHSYGLPFEVDTVGAGCLLVQREAIKAFVKGNLLPFENRLMYGGDSEDITFCHNAKTLGLRIMVHPGVRCGHVIEAVL